MTDDDGIYEEKRQEAEAIRACMAAFILRALRDLADGDPEAKDWLFASPEDLLDEFDEGVTFPSACSVLELDHASIRHKIRNMNRKEFDRMVQLLRRSRSTKSDDEDGGNGYDLAEDINTNDFDSLFDDDSDGAMMSIEVDLVEEYYDLFDDGET